MKLTGLEILPYSLPLRGRLGRSGAWLDRRDGLIVTVRDGDGACGHGEAAPASWVGGASVAAVRAALELVAVAVASGSMELERMLDALSFDSYERKPGQQFPKDLDGAIHAYGAEHALVNRIEDDAVPAVTCALETALLDLTARREGRALASVLRDHVAQSGLPVLPRLIRVNALLTAESAGQVRMEAEAAVARGFTTLKLKTGARSPEIDIERVRAVRQGASGAARLRLDANRGWSGEAARTVLSAVAGDDIEYVEEPLRDPSANAFAELAAETGCRLAVDESLEAVPDAAAYLDSLVERGAITAVIVKPMAVCGLRRAAGLAAHARAGGLDVTFTDSIETAIGRSAIVHLAAAFGSSADVIGLGGVELLARDLDGEPPRRRPHVEVEGPGLGAAPVSGRESSL